MPFGVDSRPLLARGSRESRASGVAPDIIKGDRGPRGLPGGVGASGIYTSYIFKRNESAPSTPTGSTPSGWSDGPPAPEPDYFPLWMSKATKSGAGALIGAWSTPVQLTGDDGYYINYIFKRAETVPATPTGNEASWSAAGWSDIPPAADGNPLWMSKAPHDLRSEEPVALWSTPVQLEGSSIQIQYSVNGSSGWHDTFSGGDMYMRQRVGTGAWSGAIRIAGEDGDYVELIFKRQSTAPTTPTGNAPAGWSDAPPAGTDPLWMSKGVFNHLDELQGTWSSPARLDGQGIRVEYSVNGSTSWHSTFAAGDKFMRQSVDEGSTWSAAIQIVGEEGAGLEVEYSVDGASSWHSTFTSGDLYMRQRVQGSVTWSAAMRIIGETGATGSMTMAPDPEMTVDGTDIRVQKPAGAPTGYMVQYTFDGDDTLYLIRAWNSGSPYDYIDVPPPTSSTAGLFQGIAPGYALSSGRYDSFDTLDA